MKGSDKMPLFASIEYVTSVKARYAQGLVKFNKILHRSQAIELKFSDEAIDLHDHHPFWMLILLSLKVSE